MAISIDTTFMDRLAPNVAVQFLDRVKATPDRAALRYPLADDTWQSITWGETGTLVSEYAAGLLALGIKPEQRVGIVSNTRYEWVLADLAVMCAAAATTTVYPSTNAEDTAYIISDSACQIVFAEDDEQLAKLRSIRNEIPEVTKVVVFDGNADGDWVISLDQLRELGQGYLAEHPGVIDELAASISPDQLATLIYTSGTTGRPKGVRLRHQSWVYEGAAIAAQENLIGPDDLEFRWLPLAHSFGKVLMSVQLAIGYETAIDGRVERIIDNLAIVKPTFMGAAPRIFEKAYGKIITMQEAEGGAKEKIFKGAFAVGLEVERLKREGKSIPLGLKVKHALSDKIVFSKVRDRFGGRVRFFISGAAALNKDIAEWFNAAGIVILEGYGLTETSAGTFVNHPLDNRFGTVGAVFPGSQVRLGDNDEIQVKGPGVMEGYHNLPEETASIFTEDGWLRTGDKGALDADGYLRITGRIKELFKTSQGKYVAPPMIESKFKAVCPYASQFMVVGAERPYCIALVTLDPDQVTAWADENGMAGASYADVVNSEAMQKMVGDYVDELNSHLNRWETIKKWRLLDADLSVESGELTPSMKVKRNVVESNYTAIIEEMYAS